MVQGGGRARRTQTKSTRDRRAETLWGRARHNQATEPNGVAVGQDGSVYVADLENDRVVKWAPGSARGELVAGGVGAGESLAHLDGPCGEATQGHVRAPPSGMPL